MGVFEERMNDVDFTKDDYIFMRSAVKWAEESTCVNAKVGCVLVVDERERASSRNGTVAGDNNCCEKDYYVCSHCGMEFEAFDDANEHNKYICGTKTVYPNDVPIPVIAIEKHGDDDAIIHAEINLLADCAANGIAARGGTIYVTLAPCIKCANALIQSKISRVVYKHDYTNTKGIDKLRRLGVVVEQIDC
jgi:dCMP deaminase